MPGPRLRLVLEEQSARPLRRHHGPRDGEEQQPVSVAQCVSESVSDADRIPDGNAHSEAYAHSKTDTYGKTNTYGKADTHADRKAHGSAHSKADSGGDAGTAAYRSSAHGIAAYRGAPAGAACRVKREICQSNKASALSFQGGLFCPKGLHFAFGCGIVFTFAIQTYSGDGQ